MHDLTIDRGTSSEAFSYMLLHFIHYIEVRELSTLAGLLVLLPEGTTSEKSQYAFMIELWGEMFERHRLTVCEGIGLVGAICRNWHHISFRSESEMN